MFKDLADIIYIEIYERITNKDIIVCFQNKGPQKRFLMFWIILFLLTILLKKLLTIFLMTKKLSIAGMSKYKNAMNFLLMRK